MQTSPIPRLELPGITKRFHGVLAPNAKLRAMVVPQEPEPPAQAAPPAECQASCGNSRSREAKSAKPTKSPRVGQITTSFGAGSALASGAAAAFSFAAALPSSFDGALQ